MSYKNIIYFILILTSVCSCQKKKSELNQTVQKYFCDAENANSNGNLTDINNSETEFSSKKFQSTEIAKSGKFSLKSDIKNKYVFTVNLPNPKAEQQYKVSLWRYGNNENGILVVQGEKNLYAKTSKSCEKNSQGWEKLELSFYVPSDYKNNKIKIYAWNKGEKPIFFDDILIEEIPKNINFNFVQPELKIYIEKAELNKLKKIRQSALNRGVLETDDQSWVNAVIFYGDTSYNAEIRLKGDWLDHLQGEKWSFRVKLKKGAAWNGMRTFSLQSPSIRHFLDEWLVHKILESENILTTRYGFVPISLNGKNLGYYNYEEHFEKQLVESKKRREGPILKFDEETFWAVILQNKKDKTWANYPVYEASQILPFKQNKTLKDSILKKQLLIAQNLLESYKNQKNKPSEIFDIEKLAKYHAFVSMFKIYHSMRWHNQRFYYNPVISKLEIIAYDCYVQQGALDWIKRPIFGNFSKTEIEKTKPEDRLNYYNFKDSIFVNYYTYFLQKFSDTLYLNNIFKTYEKEINFYETEIKKEFPGYSFNKNFYYTNAENIRNTFPEYLKTTKSDLYKNINSNWQTKNTYKSKYYPELPEKFIQAYLEKNESGKILLKIINYNPHDIVFLGHKISRNINNFYKNIEIKSYNTPEYQKYIEIKDNKAEIIYFSVKGYPQVYQKAVSQWKSPDFIIPQKEITEKFTVKKSNLVYTVTNEKIIFKKGNHTISETIVIPANKKVIFEAGCRLNFIKKAAFISYSPVFINGTAKEKVIFESTDKTANGFNVLQAKTKSMVNFAIFDGFNTLNYKGWQLTGAVNFYESDVEITNTIFKNNVCEDMLNTISSNFTVTNSSFLNTYADAFDSDFCTGKLNFSEFTNLGNDAIDFSGSRIIIENLQIKNPKDKGISGGEASTLYISNTYIYGGNVSITSKDNSKLYISNCEISKSNYGFVAFAKKSEYGHAYINISKIKHLDIIKPFLIEEKSELILNNKIIKGTEKKVADRFY